MYKLFVYKFLLNFSLPSILLYLVHFPDKKKHLAQFIYAFFMHIIVYNNVLNYKFLCVEILVS